MKDLLNRINARVAIIPQTQTNADTAIVGEIIDRDGFESLTFVIATGALTDANATFAVTMEEGDDSGLSDTGAVAAADMIGTTALAAFDFSSDKACRKIGYKGNKRYTRLTVTPTGNNSGAAPIAAIAVLGHARFEPTVNPPA